MRGKPCANSRTISTPPEHNLLTKRYNRLQFRSAIFLHIHGHLSVVRPACPFCPAALWPFFLGPPQSAHMRSPALRRSSRAFSHPVSWPTALWRLVPGIPAATEVGFWQQSSHKTVLRKNSHFLPSAIRHLALGFMPLGNHVGKWCPLMPSHPMPL